MQYDPPREQLRPMQRCEQHWSSVEHALPAVRQVVLSGSQVVPLHFALQQEPPPPSLEQLWPSDVHCVAQKPLAPQFKEQQSVGAEQGVPGPEHLTTVEP